jgi:hypothetical protein
MALLPIKIPAGFYRNATQYQAKNRWYDGNLVRFSEGRLRPIGGWQRLADTQITKKGAIKSLTITTAGSGYSSGTLGFSGGAGSSFAGTYSVSTVNGVAGVITAVAITNSGSGYTSIPTITISGANGGSDIDAVITPTIFSGVDPIRGLHSWRVSSGARYLAVGSVQSLRVWDGSQSSGTNSPIYDITPTTVPSTKIDFKDQGDFLIAGLGFGALEYGGNRNLDGTGGTASGGDVYGTARYPAVDPDITDVEAWRDNYAPVWSLDNFGDDLVAVQSGEGSIWYWSLATGGTSTKVFNVTSPSVVTGLVNSGGYVQNTPLSGRWKINQTHANVEQTSTSGSGTGIKFTIVTIAQDYFNSVTITSGGVGYEVDDTITLTDPATVVRNFATYYNDVNLVCWVPGGGDNSGIVVGQTVTGYGIPAGATVTAIHTNSAGEDHSITISSAATNSSWSSHNGMIPISFALETATFTVASLSSASITSTAHGLSDTNIVQVSSLGTLPTGLPAYTDLFVRDKTTDTFKLATTSGGTAMTFQEGSGEHSWTSPTGGAVTFNNANQTATSATLLSSLTNSTGVPVDNIGVLVTPERHIMILGAGGNSKRIAWGHQESLTDFTPSVTNTAGDLDIQTKGKIIGGFKTRYGVLLFFTDSVWKTNYLGPPFIYGTERLTEGGGCLGIKSVAGSADFVAWMSRGRFWSYTGGYIQELACDVADYVFSDLNTDIEGLISGGHNAEFGEITWFYPKEGDEYPTRYVTYSYREKHWTTGQLERSAWESSDSLGYPVAGGVDGYLYRHELDPDTQSTPILRESTVTAPADVTALSTLQSRVIAKGVNSTLHPNVATEEHLCYAESGAIEIGSGNKMMSVSQIITDSDAGNKGLRMKVTVQNTPDDSSPLVKGAYDLTPDGYTDTRFTGRQALLRVESPFDQEWRFGEVRFDAAVSGER